MRPTNPLFEEAVIDCVASDREPTDQELFQVAQRIWAEGAANRSAFRWGSLPPANSEKRLALRAARIALSGSVAQS